MLFASPEVAKYINENFEPTWVSVRPVPKVTIDFGNGKKMTRTVNGNVATYVCTRDGTVVDVVPGIYNRENYIAALKEIRQQFDKLPSDSLALEKELKAYHAAARPMELVNVAAMGSKTTALSVVRSHGFGINETVELRRALLTDTSLNEIERRPMIHAYLQENGKCTPEEMKKWIYREVLHADLDDPYLGFDKVLTQSYPFDDSGS